MMEIEKFKTTFCSVFAKGKIVPHLKEGEYPACIQAFPLDGNTALHYELIQRAKDGDVFLEFHVERAHYWEYEKEVRLLQDKFNTYGRDISFSTYYSSQVWKCRRPVRTESDLEEDARRMKGVVGACLKSADEKLDDGGRHEGTLQVGIAQVRLFELLHWKLRMPPIQREYCWTTENVKRLLSDLCNWRKHHKYLKYHLGSVILKEMSSQDDIFEVFDGQQRLTTFAMLFHSLPGENDVSGPALTVPLLQQKTLYSNESQTCIREVWAYLRRSRENNDFLKWVKDWIEVSVVKLGKDAPPDLPFGFFNHVNSSGVKLTDYELLKGHHLRFVPDNVSGEAAKRWHGLESVSEGGTPMAARLLHQTLYRLRMWSIGDQTQFPFDADNTEERLVFRHFCATGSPPEGMMSFPHPMDFDSLVTGGTAFFDFVSRQRNRFEAFVIEPRIKALDRHLAWHSRGVLWSGIRALCFLYYLRFGSDYLADAVKEIAIHVSGIRNETRVMGAFLSKRREFRDVCGLLRRATDEGQFFAAMEAIKTDYVQNNDGKAKTVYWHELEKLLKELKNGHA